MVKSSRLALLLIVLLASGCAGVLDPYDSKLNCPDPDFGVCTDVETAWKESFKDRQELKRQARIRAAKQHHKKCPDGDCSQPKSRTGNESQNPKDINIYFTSWLKETTKLLEQPQTPVIKPPRVLYGLIFPYDGGHGDVLFMSQRVFIIAEPPRFVLSPPWKYYKKKTRTPYVIPSVNPKDKSTKKPKDKPTKTFSKTRRTR